LRWIDFVMMMGDLGRFRTHPEFGPTTLDRRRSPIGSGNPGKFAAEIGNAFPT